MESLINFVILNNVGFATITNLCWLYLKHKYGTRPEFISGLKNPFYL